jgi:ribosomal protein L32
MGFMDTVRDKIDSFQSGDKMQYLLAGALVLIIAISLISVIVSATDSGPQNQGPRENKYYCLETGKEFTLDPEDMTDEMMMVDPMMGLVKSPYTDKKTGYAMTRCPNCEKYYVPEYVKEAYKQNPEGPIMGPMMDPAQMNETVCPHCGTNLHEYYRKKARERRK